MNKIILEARKINKNFYDPVTFRVLTDVSFSINKGDFVSLTGKSGCGKSTLLYILSTMDSDFEGELLIDNEPVSSKKESQLAKIRNEKIGFVFQFHYLLNEFSVIKNVMLPGLKLNRYEEKEVEHRAMEKLTMLGIGHLALKKAHQVSGGEKQRIAIARALINDPYIIMGDEPTGNLDGRNAEAVFALMLELNVEFGTSLVVVTHDERLAARMERRVTLLDGRLVEMV